MSMVNVTMLLHTAVGRAARSFSSPPESRIGMTPLAHNFKLRLMHFSNCVISLFHRHAGQHNGGLL
jgi:hypothetical protein